MLLIIRAERRDTVGIDIDLLTVYGIVRFFFTY